MMKDYYDDYEQNKMNERPIPENDRQEFFEAQQSADAQDVYTAQQSTDVQEYEDITGSSEQAAQSVSEGSYEWNASDGEYRHSYINGNNSTASHNPNNYEDAYSTRQDYGYQSQQTIRTIAVIKTPTPDIRRRNIRRSKIPLPDNPKKNKRRNGSLCRAVSSQQCFH